MLACRYFVAHESHIGPVEKKEEMLEKEPQKIMAVNGWVIGDDPLRNFAECNEGWHFIIFSSML
jgi:hypothetical protein